MLRSTEEWHRYLVPLLVMNKSRRSDNRMEERKNGQKGRQNPPDLRHLDSSLPYVPRKNLLSAGERRFYQQGLRPAMGDRYLISFKVRLADVITVKQWEGTYGRKIAQKHLDFVLTTPRTTRIVAAVELNDITHAAIHRQRRDLFVSDALRAAGIPLVTFPIYQRYDRQRIKRHIMAAIHRFRS